MPLLDGTWLPTREQAISIQWILETTGRYRIPEPLRRAHQLATSARCASQIHPRGQGSGTRDQTPPHTTW